MGLDNYFVDKNGDVPKIDWGNKIPVLCGGMFSGHGDDGSFRGKVYNDFVEEVTGESLYQECIPNYKVKEMANKLNDKKRRKEIKEIAKKHDITLKELESLKIMFSKFADAGSELRGWW